MALERLSTLIDRLITKSSLEVPEDFGRYDIHPRGGTLVSITTPQGTILTIGCNDVIHVREARNSSKIVSSFTSLRLPEGYTLLPFLKAESLTRGTD